MPISKIKSGAINDSAITSAKISDGGIATADLANDAVTADKVVDNIELAGTEGVRLPVGTTAQRANAQSGDIRFNSSLSLMEYYDGTNWKSIDSPPTISSSDVSDFDAEGDTITLTGSNFQSGATVKLVGDDGTEYSASSVTVTNSTTASFDITAAMATDNDPFDIVVTNSSGLSGTLANALDYAPTPAFDTASGSIGTIYDSNRDGYSLSPVTATSDEGDATLTYALGGGDSLPAGLSLNTSTGAITGTADAVGSDTTTTFDIVATATDTDSNVTTNTRSFSITVKEPVVQEFTSTGSGSFSVPTNVDIVDVLVVAGGGGGGWDRGGGGGAGGLIYRPAFPVTPGGSISYTVGAGGSAGVGPNPGNEQGGTGQDSTFGGLTSKGGGGGGYGPANPAGTDGGSGGGAAGTGGASTGTQPQQPGDSGTYGFGNAGAAGTPSLEGTGGGGAGGAGFNTSSPAGGDGGVGKQYDISGTQVYYAGGGGGGNRDTPTNPEGAGGLGGGGNGGGSGSSSIGQLGQDGTTNRGGGAGGGGNIPNTTYANGGAGGSGIVIVKY